MTNQKKLEHILAILNEYSQNIKWIGRQTLEIITATKEKEASKAIADIEALLYKNGVSVNEKKLTTEQYLKINDLSIPIAIDFTLNDLKFLRNEKLKEIIINEKKSSKEYLNEKDILNRLVELFMMLKKEE